jgi:hypothetical protein
LTRREDPFTMKKGVAAIARILFFILDLD